MPQDAVEWAESEFRGVPGLDARLQSRLVRTAAAIATRPQGSLPQRLPTWAELKGAYRLIHAVANPDAVQDVHRRRTRERMAAVRTPLLIVHDGTEFDFSSHAAVADRLGPIGDGAAYARGFQQQNTLVVDPENRDLLGLIHQQTFLRQPKVPGETRAARYRRADRESRVWMRGIEAVGRPPAGRVWVHVGDRGADLFAAMATARRQGASFLIRLAQNRRLVPPAAAGDGSDAAGDIALSQSAAAAGDDAPSHLMVAARRVAAAASATVDIAGRGGRPGRTATVSLGAVRLSFRASRADPFWRHEPAIAITAIRIWEEDPPADAEPLEWILGTDLEDASPEALQRYRSWYECRWRTMEEYHKVQKTGLGMEDLRFETRERLEAAMGMLSVVGVRMLGLRWALESCPDAPASAVADAEEIAAVESLRPGRPVATVEQFVVAVASLGGFLGRKCDGRPGWQSLWRGYQRLADILLGLELAKRPKVPHPTSSG